MRASFTLLSLLTATSVASCVLIRDFDELQAGGSEEAGAGGGTASGGTGGSAGAAGATGVGGSPQSCAERCDDNDPCTRDACNADDRCVHYSHGAIADGLDATVPTDAAQVLSLTGSAERFYAAVTTGDASASNVTLYSFGPGDSDLVEGRRVTEPLVLGANPLRAVPGARVALIAETEIPFYVQAYAALTDIPSSTPITADDLASVWQITLRSDLEPLATPVAARLSAFAQDDYAMGQPGPIAWRLGTTNHAAWIGPGGTEIRLRSAGQLAPRSLGDGITPVAAIAPLGDEQSNPGVMWLSAGQPAEAYGQVGILPPALLEGCPGAAGDFYSAQSSMIRSGMWLASWTRTRRGAGGGEVIGVNGEAQLVVCSAALGCGVFVESGQQLDCADQPRDGMYEAVAAMLQPVTEPGIVYEAIFSPQYVGTDEVTAFLQIIRVDFDNPDTNLLLFDGQGEEVATASGDPALWSPQVAFSGTDRLAVAWIEASPTGFGEAHFSRYRICPLTADDLAAAEQNATP